VKVLAMNTFNFAVCSLNFLYLFEFGKHDLTSSSFVGYV